MAVLNFSKWNIYIMSIQDMVRGIILYKFSMLRWNYVFDKPEEDREAEHRTDILCIPYVRGASDRLRKSLWNLQFLLHWGNIAMVWWERNPTQTQFTELWLWPKFPCDLDGRIFLQWHIHKIWDNEFGRWNVEKPTLESRPANTARRNFWEKRIVMTKNMCTCFF